MECEHQGMLVGGSIWDEGTTSTPPPALCDSRKLFCPWPLSFSVNEVGNDPMERKCRSRRNFSGF